jgi:hypothetical protein
MNVFAKVIEFLMIYLPHANAMGTPLMLFVILPLGFFRLPAMITIPFGYLLTFVFGFSLWFFSAVLVYSYLGLFWLIVCLLFIIGVIPVAFVCLLLNAEWTWFFSMLALLISVFAFRGLLLWQAARLDRRTATRVRAFDQ